MNSKCLYLKWDWGTKIFLTLSLLISFQVIAFAESVVARKIEKHIGKMDYSAQLQFDGEKWILSVHHEPSDLLEVYKDDFSKKSSEWFGLTYRSALFEDNDFAEVQGFVSKFMEWDKVAKDNTVPPFKKEMGKSRKMFHEEFWWDGKESRWFPRNMDAIDVALFQELLGKAEEMKAEWAKKRVETEKAKELFK